MSNMNYLQFEFENESLDQNDMLIAYLSELGFEGFEEDGTVLRGYIQDKLFNQQAFDETLAHIEQVVYLQSTIQQVNWNEIWENQFHPVLVDDFAAVRAGFHEPVAGVLYDLVITPKMSFGTGHHATTWMMMQLMRDIDFNSKKVFDFGTGTGVLAILAEKMGAASVRAIDNDLWSIENTQENLLANSCRNISVELMSEVPSNTQYEVILANINLNVIMANAAVLYQIALPGAVALFSGFLTTDEQLICEKLQQAGFQVTSVLSRGEWLAVKAVRHG